MPTGTGLKRKSFFIDTRALRRAKKALGVATDAEAVRHAVDIHRALATAAVQLAGSMEDRRRERSSGDALALQIDVRHTHQAMADQVHHEPRLLQSNVADQRFVSSELYLYIRAQDLADDR